jgi:hypothetical protein
MIPPGLAAHLAALAAATGRAELGHLARLPAG